MSDTPCWWNAAMAANLRLRLNNGRIVQLFGSTESFPSPPRLTIHRHHLTSPEEPNWQLAWHVYDDWDETRGLVVMPNRRLRQAFGLEAQPIHDPDRWFDSRFESDAAVAGQFIRFGDCLNIPTPGFGQRREKTISILITPELQHAVSQLCGLPASVPATALA